MFRFLNKKVQYTVSYNKQINLKPQNYENLFTFISRVSSAFGRKYSICGSTAGETRDRHGDF